DPGDHPSFCFSPVPGGAYSLELWRPAKWVDPGQSIQATDRFDVLLGLSSIDLVSETWATQLVSPDKPLMAGDTLHLEARLAGPGAESLPGGKIPVSGNIHFQEQSRTLEPKAAPGPGQARVWTWDMPTDGWADGKYQVRLTSPDGREVARPFT